MSKTLENNLKVAFSKEENQRSLITLFEKTLTRKEIFQEVRKAKRELHKCFESSNSYKKDQAINNCYLILHNILRKGA